MFTPETLEIVMVSFEGPDRYSLVGGLGVRARELCRAFAAMRFHTTLVFIGDPERPLHEVEQGVHLVRWGQDLSREYPAGAYDGEVAKAALLADTLPDFLARHVVRPAALRGRTVAVLAEEWQTASFCGRLSDLLHQLHLRQQCVIVWNANNYFGFERLEWGTLGYVAAITTVSRYMKQLMLPHGVNPVVVPNGIPRASLDIVDRAAVRVVRAAGDTPCLLLKMGRFHPDKRWHQAVSAVSQLRHQGMPARLLMRGGAEPFGGAVLNHARTLGLDVAEWLAPVEDLGGMARALGETAGAPIVNLCRYLPDPLLPTLQAAATAVLANSGHEPFGLVGLEAMAAGGIAVVGSTGEEYARPYGNAIVVESDDPIELAGALAGVVERPALDRRLRAAARRDAADYAWPVVIEGLLERLRFFSQHQRVAIPAQSRRAHRTTGGATPKRPLKRVGPSLAS